MTNKTTFYPQSFMVYRREIRQKAMEIANFLFSERYNNDVAENIAISSAKNWAAYCLGEDGCSEDCRVLHLVPHPNGWALFKADINEFLSFNAIKNVALSEARLIAKSRKMKLFLHDHRGCVSDCECFNVNRPFALRPPVSVKNGWVSAGDS